MEERIVESEELGNIVAGPILKKRQQDPGNGTGESLQI